MKTLYEVKDLGKTWADTKYQAISYLFYKKYNRVPTDIEKNSYKVIEHIFRKDPKHLIFIDFEVFKHDWLVVIADMWKKEFSYIINDKQKLTEFYEKNKSNIFIGYNIKGYDQYIFKGIITGFNPYDISKFIIQDKQPGYKFSTMLRTTDLLVYDCMAPLDHGLKFAEGSMGSNIKESDVPFDIDRKLTTKEISETLEYCFHDVEETIKVFMKRYEDFTAQLGLCKLAGEGLRYLSKTQTQMAAIILKANKHEYNDEFDIDVPDTLKITKYQEVVDWYKEPQNMDYKKSLDINIAGVPHTFAFGGLHGAIEKYHTKGNLLMLDVESLYPSLMIRYDLLSRSVLNPSIYASIKETRIKYKHEKNPLHLPLKLVLNKTYGAMKDKFNNLYDPRQANRVCIYGQLLLLDLIEHLEPFSELIQSNTDGILIKYENRPKIEEIAKEWQDRTGLKLEFDDYIEVWQKDVNNYIIKANDNTLKTKGAYVKKLSTLDYGDYPVVNHALIENIVNGVDIKDTIDNAPLKDFQMVCKITGKYTSIYHGDNNLNLRCVRAFASIDNNAPGIYKRHSETMRLEKISNSPEHTFIINDDVNDMPMDNRLDKDFYIKLTEKRVNDFYV